METFHYRVTSDKGNREFRELSENLKIKEFCKSLEGIREFWKFYFLKISTLFSSLGLNTKILNGSEVVREFYQYSRRNQVKLGEFHELNPLVILQSRT